MAATGVSSDASSVLVLSRSDVKLIVIGLVFVALVVVLQPLLLSISYKGRKEPSGGKPSDLHSSFFEVPYVTWFLIHHGIAALAMISILILGLDGVIDKTTIAALLGSLFGYVLGSSSRSSQAQPKDDKRGANPSQPGHQS